MLWLRLLLLLIWLVIVCVGVATKRWCSRIRRDIRSWDAGRRDIHGKAARVACIVAGSIFDLVYGRSEALVDQKCGSGNCAL